MEMSLGLTLELKKVVKVVKYISHSTVYVKQACSPTKYVQSEMDLLVLEQVHLSTKTSQDFS
jgi:hypothetical protein